MPIFRVQGPTLGASVLVPTVWGIAPRARLVELEAVTFWCCGLCVSFCGAARVVSKRMPTQVCIPFEIRANGVPRCVCEFTLLPKFSVEFPPIGIVCHHGLDVSLIY